MDKYQGQQNDIIIVSLVRTAVVGHVRDPRRLVVAVSRARLGLFILGKFNIFSVYPETHQTFELLGSRPLHLQLYPHENNLNLRKYGEGIDPKKVTSIGNYHELYEVVQYLLQDKIANEEKWKSLYSKQI